MEANSDISASERVAIKAAVRRVYSKLGENATTVEEPVLLYVGTGKDDGFARDVGASRRTALRLAASLNKIGVFDVNIANVKKGRPDGSVVEYKEVLMRPLHATPQAALQHAAVWRAPEGKAKNGHGGARDRQCDTCPDADIEVRTTTTELEKVTTEYICKECGDLLDKQTETRQIRTRTARTTIPGQAPFQDDEVLGDETDYHDAGNVAVETPDRDGHEGADASPRVIDRYCNAAELAGCSEENGAPSVHEPAGDLCPLLERPSVLVTTTTAPPATVPLLQNLWCEADPRHRICPHRWTGSRWVCTFCSPPPRPVLVR
jgi:hypothetical protein